MAFNPKLRILRRRKICNLQKYSITTFIYVWITVSKVKTMDFVISSFFLFEEEKRARAIFIENIKFIAALKIPRGWDSRSDFGSCGRKLHILPRLYYSSILKIHSAGNALSRRNVLSETSYFNTFNIQALFKRNLHHTYTGTQYAAYTFDYLKIRLTFRSSHVATHSRRTRMKILAHL